MKITLTSFTSDEVILVEVSEDTELDDFKMIVHVQTSIDISNLVLLFNGNLLQDGKRTLGSYGVSDGDVICMQKMDPAAQSYMRSLASQSQGASASNPFAQLDFSSMTPSAQRSQRPASSRVAEDAEYVRQMFLTNDYQLSLLRERNIPLAETVHDAAKFKAELERQQNEKRKRDEEKARILSNPLHPDAQKLIADEIRMDTINEHMEQAMEFSPESFGVVTMLYIDIMVNKVPVKAFVDSGAQMTIMSRECAERCNVMRLVDTRWAGVAKGVGTQKIIGRAHMVQLQIKDVFLQSAVSVLEEQPMDMLLGLDMLKRHQCCIDLKSNQLVIGTTGTATPFLSESELPLHARLNSQQNPAIESTSSQSSDVPEETIKRIVDMGFSRAQVIKELQTNNGDVNKTIASLLASSIKIE